MQAVKIKLEDTTLYRLDFWTKVFSEPREKGADGYLSQGLDNLESFFKGKPEYQYLFDGLQEYMKLRVAGADNGDLRAVIERMHRRGVR